ncbi:putative colanic acid biosynthesis acetyltransferase [Chroococcidiopsis sp. TS-821]|uniref:putative colanic acid biosynthesis acetyltransferase n=1 Tax=Chroococcidiopsis sp. TS-821 TaxID=1378066 RepID=UPI000CEE2CAA|nr:putative colanic acid biosynthesis acetyltransferase [Chroococcidiopsis sp. TS-821]PPS42772.1 colanic acid biosynthesis acetyltransferase WcaF [Chroococcidiopsis sp. TS-821]
MRLDQYTLGNYTPGAPLWKQLLWYFLGEPLFRAHWLPVSAFKVSLLRLFGGKVGQQVRIKPGVRVKFPWRLTVGDYTWIGENAWLDNVAPITIESHVCISQDVYLCTGNHDWRDPHFKLIPAAIYIAEGSWIAARAVVGPGVTIGKGAVLALGSVTGRSLEPMTIYAGNPAQPIKQRIISEAYTSNLHDLPKIHFKHQ